MSARACPSAALPPVLSPAALGAVRRAGATIAFARAAVSYWLGVFPLVCGELRAWRSRAQAIGDPELRELALAALAKRGNMEGAAAFATFAPLRRRRQVVRATVAFQAAYNHLDALSERSAAPGEQARRLHRALLVALGAPAADGAQAGAQPASDVGASGEAGADGGYLSALVEACRESFFALPAAAAAAPAARRAAERVVEFQAHQACGGRAALDQGTVERFGEAVAPAGAGLRWWEALAASGSSLAVHALIAAAAEGCDERHAAALQAAYSTRIGALHTLLDHLIDGGEDRVCGQRNLIACYCSPVEARERMGVLAARALADARALGQGARHELIVAAMASFYLAAPEAGAPGQAPVAQAVREQLGSLGRLAEAVFVVRRAA